MFLNSFSMFIVALFETLWPVTVRKGLNCGSNL